MHFFKEFIKNPIKTGAILPSSESLAELITDTAQLKNKKCIVEFGSGTGVFTEKILQKINGDSTFFSIEINDFFVKKTKNKCPDAIVYNDSAENIDKYLNKHNKTKCDCIISGLPWAAFNKTLQYNLLNSAYNSLEKDGVFLTFAYLQGVFLPSGKKFKKLLYNKFNSVKTTKIIRSNIPPAFIYYCKK